MSAQPVSLSAYVRLVRENRNFRLLWLAQIVSEMGDWLYSVAIYSLLLELTGSARSLSLALVLQLLPQFFIGPVAGVVNDRLSRKQVMIFADLARAGVVLAMVLVRSRETVWVIYALLFLETILWAFFEPGRNGVVPNITRSPDETVAANGLGSITWSVNLALGSSLGGAVAVLFGRDAVFVVNSISFLISAALLRRMRFDEPHAEARGLALSDLVDYQAYLEGLRYVWRDRRLLATLMVKGGFGLAAAHWVILPVFGERIFPVHFGSADPRRAGMLGMSLLMGARGVGSLLGPLIAGYAAGSDQRRLRHGVTYGFLAMCAGYAVLSVAPTLSVAVLGVLVAHGGGSTIWVFSTTLLQMGTDDRYRGRVFSADFGLLTLTMALTTWVAGAVCDAGVGVRTVALVSGIVALGPAALWAWGQRLWRTPPGAAAAEGQ